MRIVRLLGYALLVVLTGLIAVRWIGLDRWTPLIQAMIFVPYLAALCLLVMIALFATGRRRLAVWALVVLVAYFAALLPRWAVEPVDAPKGFKLRVMSVNLHAGGASAKELMTHIAADRPDLLAVQELTDAEVTALEGAGIAQYLPVRALHPAPGHAGSGLYSRAKLTGARVLSPDSTYAMERADMAVGDTTLDVVSVHTRPPRSDAAVPDWLRDLGLLPKASAAGTQLLVGDFNATDDQRGLRQLTHGDYVDAAASVGSGLRPTWRRLPVTLDHVLTERRMTTTAVHTYALSGADHKILEVDMVLTGG